MQIFSAKCKGYDERVTISVSDLTEFFLADLNDDMVVSHENPNRLGSPEMIFIKKSDLSELRIITFGRD